MITVSVRKMVALFFVSAAGYFVLGSTLPARSQTLAALDRLIPRDKWEEAGLNKLTATEQQTLASDITSLLAASGTMQNGTSPATDRSQWRKLRRHMNKDDVRNLLGEPRAVTVSGVAESWYYVNGNVTFDSKGRLDMWSEM